MIESLLHKEELSLIFSAKKLIRQEVFHKQCVYHQKSINVQQNFHLGHRTTLYCEGLKCQQEFAYYCLLEGELSVKIEDIPSRLAYIFIRLFWSPVRKQDSCLT